MSYFNDAYSELRFPLAENDQPGFREAQRGALFAIAAHFATRADPAIVTMPTGSGKTAVLQAAAILLRSKRVLVLTPSRLVREQIAEDFAALRVLKRIGAVSDAVAAPAVFATKKRMSEAADWAEALEYDVVVATVQSVSPAIDGVATPPEDIFDLILVDEAHHSPASTWAKTLEHFPNAKKVLFTATPFRRDDREIKGRFVFTYDIRKAYSDGVFGHIEYQPVEEAKGAANQVLEDDKLVAKAAEAKLTADRAEGFQHLLMVRTDSRKRADELSLIYAENTNLRLQVIHGAQSLGAVKKTLASLEANLLDGVICVNMLGEGFDMPRLKVAAIHAPHRSLAVTLQFIGRFARTAGERLGSATFISTRTGVEVEAEKLYTSGAIWSEIIPNLSEVRVQKEVEVREILDGFDVDADTAPDLSDLSLYALFPYSHVKIFRLREDFDIHTSPEFGWNMEQVFGRVSGDSSAAIYITRERRQVSWSDDDKLVDTRYDLFVIYYHRKSNLLFICSTKRADGFYRRLARALVGYDPRILGLSYLNRALRGLESPRFYNVGMRNRQHSSLTESYRMLAGSRVDEAIRPEDARLYHRGHCFGSAKEDGVDVTIGLSSASKIWSNSSPSLTELISWCEKIANKIDDKKPAPTGSKLDLLDMGEIVSEIPNAVLWAEWDKDIYINPPIATCEIGGILFSRPLTEYELLVTKSSKKEVHVTLASQDINIDLIYKIAEDPFFAYAKDDITLSISSGRHDEDIVDYLNDNPLNFMTENWSRLCGEEYFAAPVGGIEPFDLKLVVPIDWAGDGVDVEVEYADRNGKVLANSIQLYLAQRLKESDADLVYWDHGSGEAADFIVIKRVGLGVDVQLFHCKSSGGAKAGNRVDDVYEVCGQAVKSAIWCDLPRLAERILDRFRRNVGVAQFVKGDARILEALAAERPVLFEMVVVQPGVGQSSVEQKLAEVLGAADSHLTNAGHKHLVVWGSV